MKPKSYLIIAVPPGESELTDTLLAELRKQLTYLEIRTKESTNGKYRVAEAFIHDSESVRDLATGKDGSGSAAMAAAAHIVMRVTGCAP